MERLQVGGGWRRGDDGEVEIVRWRLRGGRIQKRICEEWHHQRSVNIWEKQCPNRAGVYIY